ncbi:MAG TPA: DUF4349 domain-containing protein [Gemmatimonadales bacterium]|nr:DUF4349 domain-containing protein [Gemmatimonadales bacterium]
MRAWMMLMGSLPMALLIACGDTSDSPKVARERDTSSAQNKANPVTLGAVGQTRSEAEAAPASADYNQSAAISLGSDPASRIIIRTGQASIEVDSLESAMAELRRAVLKVGGFVADASVQSGRNQIRSATLELKVPSLRFDELTETLGPIGRLQHVNVGAEDVSEEFVDLTARVANGRRLEDRLVELLRTRTGKLQDVLTVERELARVREEIERMEGRLRFLKTSAELSTLSVNLYEPAPLVASQPGYNPIAEAFKTAWRNFVGVIAGVIASLGFVVPVAMLGWGAFVVAKKYGRKVA